MKLALASSGNTAKPWKALYNLKEKPLREDDIEKRAEWTTIRKSRPKKRCIRKPHAILDNKNFEATRCAKRCILVELMLGWSMGCHCCQGLLVELVLWWLMSCHFCQCILFGHVLWWLIACRFRPSIFERFRTSTEHVQSTYRAHTEHVQSTYRARWENTVKVTFCHISKFEFKKH